MFFLTQEVDNKTSICIYSEDFYEVFEQYKSAKRLYDGVFTIYYRNSNLHDFKVVALYDYDVIVLQNLSGFYLALDIRKNNSLGLLTKNKSLGAVKTFLYNRYYSLIAQF